MAEEIELVSDGGGLAILGDPVAVERFMDSTGIPRSGSVPMGTVLAAGATVAQTGAQIASESGRWVKLTSESAQAVKQFGLVPTSTPGVSHAMVGQPGNIKQWVQIVTKPGALATNPAMLAGAAGMMAQFAMQQQMDAIVDYLAKIDAKLDDVLRSLTNQMIARLDGVDLTIRDAMNVRSAVGSVSEVTWSKVQAATQTIHEVEGYVLHELRDLGGKVERAHKPGQLVDITRGLEPEVTKWLVVLARCFELHDSVGVLELDRMMQVSPEELDRHRLGLIAAREHRRQEIEELTRELLSSMDMAIARANDRVFFNPRQSPSVVKASNHVTADVHEFRELLGIESTGGVSEPRKWRDAASEQVDRALETGAQGVQGAKRLGGAAVDKVKAKKERLSERRAQRKNSRPERDQT